MFTVDAGPNYPYDYNVNTWDGSYQQLNTSTYYDAQKHAYLQPGTAGAFEWNIRDNSGGQCLRVRLLSNVFCVGQEPRVRATHWCLRDEASGASKRPMVVDTG